MAADQRDHHLLGLGWPGTGLRYPAAAEILSQATPATAPAGLRS